MCRICEFLCGISCPVFHFISCSHFVFQVSSVSFVFLCLMAFSHFLYSNQRNQWAPECRFFYSLHSNRLLIPLTLYSVRTFHPSCSPVSLGISTTFLFSRVSFSLTVPTFLIILLGKHILHSPLWSTCMVSNLEASVSTTSGFPWITWLFRWDSSSMAGNIEQYGAKQRTAWS